MDEKEKNDFYNTYKMRYNIKKKKIISYNNYKCVIFSFVFVINQGTYDKNIHPLKSKSTETYSNSIMSVKGDRLFQTKFTFSVIIFGSIHIENN